MDFVAGYFEETKWGYEVAKLNWKGVPKRHADIIKYDARGVIKGALVFFPGQFLLAPFYGEMLSYFASQGYIVFVLQRSSEVSGTCFSDLGEGLGMSASVGECLGALKYVAGYLEGCGLGSLPMYLLGHSLGGEFALTCLGKYSRISKVVVVESCLALESKELRENQNQYCEYLRKQINKGETHISSIDSIINVALAAYYRPNHASESVPGMTNLEVFRFAVGMTSQIKNGCYTPWYHYFDCPGGVKFPLDVVDEKGLLRMLISGHGNLDSLPKSVATHSSIISECAMSLILSGEICVNVPPEIKVLVILFSGGIGVEGKKGLDEVGFKTEILQGAHASIVHCPQSPDVWRFILDFFENEK